jgi:hypothetical protein
MQDQNKEILQQSGVALIKSALGNIPVVGGLLNEALFEIRSRIKQDRINFFVESLSQTLLDSNLNGIDQKHLSSEGFSDLLENVLIKVSKTRSKKKTEIFKNLLVTSILVNNSLDEIELYTDIIDSISEKQILILNGLSLAFNTNYIDLQRQILSQNLEIKQLKKEEESRHHRFEGFDNQSFSTTGQINGLTREMERLKGIAEPDSKYFKAATYHCEGYEFLYHLQDLAAKGLIVDIGMGSGAEPLQLIEITEIGLGIIKYLNNNSDS